MRWLRLALLLLIGLPALLLAGLATPFGMTQVARIAQWAVPGLTIEGLAGPLPSGIGFSRVTLADDEGVWLTVEDARLDLAWRALLRGEAHITRLAAARVALDRLPAGETTPEPEPAELALPELPELPVALRLDALEVARIELGPGIPGGPAVFRASGAALLDGAAARLDLDLARLDAPGRARLAARIEGDVLEASLDAEEPPGGVVAALAGLPGAGFDARLALTGGGWTLAAQLGEASLQGEGVLALRAGELTASARIEARPGPLLPPDLLPLADSVRLDLALRRAADGALRLERLVAEAPAGRAEAHGDLAADGALAASATLHPAASGTFAALLPEGVGWTGGVLRLEAAGSLEAPRLSLDAELHDPRAEPSLDPLLGERLTLLATLESGGEAVTLDLAAARLRLQAEGRALEPMELRVAARVTDPPEVAGSIALAGTLRGEYAAPHLEAVLESEALAVAGRRAESLHVALDARLDALALTAEGVLDGQPLRLAVRADQPAPDRLRLRELDAAWAGITLAGEAELALAPEGPHRADLRLAAPDLSVLGVGATGSLTAEITAAPIPDATGPAAQGLALRLDSPGFTLGGQDGRIQAALTGTLAEAELTLSAAGAGVALEAAALLATGADTTAEFSRLELRAAGETLRLEGPARITLTEAGAVRLDPSRFRAARGGQLTLQGSLQEGALAGEVLLAALPLGPFTEGAAEGTLAGEVTLSGTIEAPRARFTLRGEGLAAAALPALPPAALTATGEAGPDSARIEAQLSAGPGVALNLTAAQPRGLGPAAATEARLTGQLELGPLTRALLAGGADQVQGQVALDIGLAGSLAAPRLTGGATLSEGSYRNTEFGVRLDGMTARLEAEGERLWLRRFEAATLGQGRIAAQGWVEPLGPGIPAELSLTMTRARPIQSELGEAVLNGTLNLTGPLLGGGSLTGRIEIARAEFRLPEQVGGSIPTLGAVREVGPMPPGRTAPPPPSAAPAAPPGPPLALDLTVSAPRAIFVRGRGLEAELQGDLRVLGNLAAPEVTGGFQLRRGSFDLAGRNLNLARGAARFDTGTLVPSLDFLATSRTPTHLIRLTITGPADSPQLAVGAEPDLPQDEALARLLFQRETSRLSPLELLSLTQAVGQLAGIMPSGGGVTGRLHEALGLDRLSAGMAEEGGGATLEAGRYVAPGVYLGIRQGTGGGPPGVGVQVELTPRLSLEAETQTGPAGDRLGLTWELEY